MSPLRHYMCSSVIFFFLACVPSPSALFFFHDAAPTAIYTLSLHDALPISGGVQPGHRAARRRGGRRGDQGLHLAEQGTRSEEHTSELQSRFDLVCRLLLEKKKTHKERTVITKVNVTATRVSILIDHSVRCV